ncbi:TPA: hypothetical protein VDW69_003170 [Pseudomonas aeruginosa]|nr:hypothetical protein [Pseudomonas aeruginosa]
MARPFVAPDPGDRSPNEPTLIASSAQVLGLYNQENPDDKRVKVTEPVKEWYATEMTKLGWKTAAFHGSQCMLEADVVLKKHK